MSPADIEYRPPLTADELRRMCSTSAGRKAVEGHAEMLRTARREYVEKHAPTVEKIRKTADDAEAVYNAHVARIDGDLSACEAALGSTGEIAA